MEKVKKPAICTSEFILRVECSPSKEMPLIYQNDVESEEERRSDEVSDSDVEPSPSASSEEEIQYPKPAPYIPFNLFLIRKHLEKINAEWESQYPEENNWKRTRAVTFKPDDELVSIISSSEVEKYPESEPPTYSSHCPTGSELIQQEVIDSGGSGDSITATQKSKDSTASAREYYLSFVAETKTAEKIVKNCLDHPQWSRPVTRRHKGETPQNYSTDPPQKSKKKPDVFEWDEAVDIMRIRQVAKNAESRLKTQRRKAQTASPRYKEFGAEDTKCKPQLQIIAPSPRYKEFGGEAGDAKPPKPPKQPVKYLSPSPRYKEFGSQGEALRKQMIPEPEPRKRRQHDEKNNKVLNTPRYPRKKEDLDNPIGKNQTNNAVEQTTTSAAAAALASQSSSNEHRKNTTAASATIPIIPESSSKNVINEPPNLLSIFTKTSLKLLNNIEVSECLPDLRAQISRQKIPRAFLSNVFNEKVVNLIFDDESSTSKWATKPFSGHLEKKCDSASSKRLSSNCQIQIQMAEVRPKDKGKSDGRKKSTHKHREVKSNEVCKIGRSASAPKAQKYMVWNANDFERCKTCSGWNYIKREVSA